MNVSVEDSSKLIQEKVRRSPKGFVRNGNEREREREGGGGGGAEVRSRETSSKTNWLEGAHQRHKCADLPSSWRLTSTRTHSLPRTLVFRGFTSHQLGSRSLTLGPLVDTAFMTSHGHQRTATSGLHVRALTCMSASRVDFSSSVTPASPPVPTLRLSGVPRSGGESVKETTNLEPGPSALETVAW